MKRNPEKNKTIDDFFREADIHDTRREQNGGLITFVVSLVVLVVECTLAYWAVHEQLSLGFVLGMHAIVVILLALYCLALMKRGNENRFALLLFMTTSTTGPYGAAGTLMTVILYSLFVRRSQSFEDWYESIFPSLKQSRSQRIYDDLVVGRDESSRTYSVIPFLDVLSFGDELQKRQALAKMTSQFNPNFAPAFKKALVDESNTIRVQAATAISKIENAFMEQLMKLSALKERFEKQPVVVRALAEHYDNYAYTGLLDADREHANRKKALEHYQEYLVLEPQSLEVRTRVGRLLMRAKEYEKAANWLRQSLDLGYQSEAIAQWYGEALFNSGKYEELRRFSAANASLLQGTGTPQPLALKEASQLWATSGSGAL